MTTFQFWFLIFAAVVFTIKFAFHAVGCALMEENAKVTFTAKGWVQNGILAALDLCVIISICELIFRK